MIAKLFTVFVHFCTDFVALVNKAPNALVRGVNGARHTADAYIVAFNKVVFRAKSRKVVFHSVIRLVRNADVHFIFFDKLAHNFGFNVADCRNLNNVAAD